MEKHEGRFAKLSVRGTGLQRALTIRARAVVGPFSFIAIILSYCLDNVQLDSL